MALAMAIATEAYVVLGDTVVIAAISVGLLIAAGASVWLHVLSGCRGPSTVDTACASPTIDFGVLITRLTLMEDQLRNLHHSFYDKTEVDKQMLMKAEAANTYTKEQMDGMMLLKANCADFYSATQIDQQLAMKVDVASTYFKEEIDAKMSVKADVTEMLSKVQIEHMDQMVKADAIYTKQQTDCLMQRIRDQLATSAYLNTHMAHGVPLGKVRIKSSTYKEYLYSKDCKGDGQRRYVHTLIGGSQPPKRGAGHWNIEWIGPSTFTIWNCEFKEYLYPKHDKNDGSRRMVHTYIGGTGPGNHNSWGNQNEWFIEITTAGHFIIMSKMFREFLYAEHGLNDGKRRFVHTWIPSRSIDDQCAWMIEPVKNDSVK